MWSSCSTAQERGGPVCWPTRFTGVIACLEQAHEVVSGACAFCSRALDAEDGVREADLPFLEEYKGAPQYPTPGARGTGGPHVLRIAE